MKKCEKAKVMNRASEEINRAKDAMNRAVCILEEQGMPADAETLYRMILKLEMFQTKYDPYRL